MRQYSKEMCSCINKKSFMEKINLKSPIPYDLEKKGEVEGDQSWQ